MGAYDQHMPKNSAAKRVLFVCMGNICRSPTGEGVMKKLVDDRGMDDRVEVDSAGTISYHTGDGADSRMRSAAKRRGYHLESIARQFVPDDFENFDLILAMDRDNLADLRGLTMKEVHHDKLRLFGSFLPDEDDPDVPDPYYGGASGFDTVLDMIEEACPHILEHLLR